MKILAVIPARAGSKGIPNKNIRLVGGFPLIYYAINNAKESRYITDIVVTTDSEEIKIIAKQMNVAVKDRSNCLCGDAVTLDSVVYDACQGHQWDYVITMQPTSPTLRGETLDAAIEQCIQAKVDTMISVVNRPHLSWKDEEGVKYPNYVRRLNRQQLPANYMETGAFLIAKYSVITQNSRIGETVEVFALSEEEAVDIDSYSDLKNAEDILTKKKVAIYVNGNNKRGVGHIYRALEIADEFSVSPDIFYDRNQTSCDIFGNTTHRIVSVDGIHELFTLLEKRQYNILINDILSTSIDYMIALRKVLPNAKIINFEDDGEGIYNADLVFNALYEKHSIPYVYVGERYYIASKLFMFYKPIEIHEKVQMIFISFGGADPQNYSDRLLNIIQKSEYAGYQFKVVLGRAKLNVEELMKYNAKNNIEVLYDIKNMPEIMSQCDIAVTSRGRTAYELAMLGIPTIAMAQNKREEKHGFVCAENGFNYLGLGASDEIIEATLKMYLSFSKSERLGYQQTLLKHDLRNGRKRVMDLILGLETERM